MGAHDPIDWRDNCTLKDYVVYLFARNETHSREFQALLRIFGRPKLEGIWRDYKSEPKKDPRVKDD